jgi:hypothetical protein
MKNTILNCMSFIDPATPEVGPVEYAWNTLSKKYGWTNARLFFGGLAAMDLDEIGENLKCKAYVPENTPIVFDLERPDCTIHFPDYEKIDKPSTSAMALREKVLALATTIRPDCPSTFYSFTTPDWWVKYQNNTDIESMRKLMRFSAPVLRRQSFICPQFYITKSYDPRRTMQWIRQEIRLIRECQPFAEIVPMFSPIWYENMNEERWGADYPWTQAVMDEIAIPADFQRSLFYAMKNEGITKLAAYVPGYCPWPLAEKTMQPIIDWTK